MYKHLKDAVRQGRPATVTTNNIVKFHQILQKDTAYTVRQSARMADLSLARIHGFFFFFKEKSIA
jgi:hypothetical protein